ncbi:hypothetical protein GCM10011494_03730 [Novosphingobium endophyticum]|uniref:DUF3617 family protein n=1 Tax=Novosphingobium endophyticum TaxID=1955250 RepID=A0A916X3Z2_9SPHN|nr:hypothetical protein [Novosphingobium endophyticum]GGB88695.1 hypothetical protein GCM10011494_03730 [Novosphingobium endophyticum]
MKRLALAALIGGISTVFTVPAHGERAALAMLDQLDSGAWELRQIGHAGVSRSICLDNGRKLIQLEHPGAVCSSVIVEDKPNEVTVQYTCRGKGYGRTHIRRETNALVQIDSQGIVDGRPFAFAAEGRRVGGCRS